MIRARRVPRLEERARRRLRQFARIGPAGGERHARDAAALAAERAQRARADAREPVIERRPPRDRAERAQQETRAGRGEPRVELHPAQLLEQRRQRNLHRTHFRAAPVQRARVRQIGIVLDALQQRRENGAHRPRIDPAVCMATDRAVHRAMVHARAAADAAQHVAEFAGEHPRAAVVDEHHVVFLRAVEIVAAPRARAERRVRRDLLPRRAAAEQAHEQRDVVERRHDALDARRDDVYARERRRQIAVALVRADHVRPRFGNEVVRAGDAHVRDEELLAQHLARLADDVRNGFARPVVLRARMVPGEQFGYLTDRLVQRRKHDVARPFVRELHDVFAEIGLDDFHARALERGGQADLLADHRLAARDGLRVRVAADLQHDLARLRRVVRPVDDAARARDGRFIAFEIRVEIREHVVLHRLRALAQHLELGQERHDAPPLLDPALAEHAERFLKLRVVQRGARARLERRWRIQGCRAHSPSPQIGSTFMPASTSAT
ncbi:hypothetical protein DP42_5166 [Burkholderia pseudomallei]|nr:hypothetical protein DO73_4440 [Burkholderia pseudomallei]KGD25254.1 hypothetical protein DP42_5166 [Burkholderia pseudomallei]